MGITLDIDLVWEELPGDGSLCKGCKEPIFYKMHTMVIVSGPERTKTNNILCDSCYNVIDHE